MSLLLRQPAAQDTKGRQSEAQTAEFVRKIRGRREGRICGNSFNDAADCLSQAVSAAGTASWFTGIAPASATAAGAGNSNGPFGGSMANLRAMISFEYLET